MYYVYAAIHTADQKVYIGFTSRTVQKRWQEHLSIARNAPILPFHRAIAKHGAHNFELRTLEKDPNEDTALDAEKYLIKSCNATNPDCGYNLSEGGKYPGRDERHPRYRSDVPTETFVRLYKAGVGMKALAREFGIAHGTIANRLNKAGIPIRRLGAHKGNLDDIVDTIRKQYLAGSTTKEIADWVGSTHWIVWNTLRRHGVPLRPKGWPRSCSCQ